MNNSKPKSAAEHNYNRACDACRLHKVRCLPETAAGSSKVCQRCSKTGRECVFTAPQKRKQRKRTDTRVAELEREVQAMRALFDTRRSTGSGSGSQSIASSSRGLASEAETKFLPVETSSLGPASEGGALRSAGSSSTSSEPRNTPGWVTSPFSPELDVIDRGVVSMPEAEELYRVYNTELIQHYPAVFFPAELTAEALRRSRPTLFLAVIAAAAGKVDPSLYSILNSEVLQAYAHRTVVNSEKSLELVQAMIITCIWYFPPGRFSQLKFYEYIHMAVTMAIDIGLGTNPRPSRSRRAGDSPPAKLEEDDFERRRAFLVCYLISTGASMSMRRPNMLRYNSWIDECLRSIIDNENPYPLDGSLIEWVKLLKAAEEIHVSMSFDDVGDMASLSENRVQLMLYGFEKALDSWYQNTRPGALNDSLRIAYYYTQLNLHEIGLHDDHPAEDFRPPFKINRLLSIQVIPEAKSSHIEVVSAAISHAHSLIDVLLGMTIDELRAVPIFNFVRMTYSVIVLLKIYISSKSPESKIGSVVDPQTIKLDVYLDSIIQKLGETVGTMEFRAPFTFLGLMIRLSNWYQETIDDSIFVPPPIAVSLSMDECWLPPVPAIVRKQIDNGLPNDYEFLQATDPMFAEGSGALPSQHGEFEMEIQNSLEIDSFLSYEGLDPHFNTWLPDSGAAETLPKMLDDNLELQNYDWGFPLADEAPSGVFQG